MDLGLKTQFEIKMEFLGGMSHYHEACVEAKQSRGELMTVKCKNQNMGHFASKVKWFMKISSLGIT